MTGQAKPIHVLPGAPAALAPSRSTFANCPSRCAPERPTYSSESFTVILGELQDRDGARVPKSRETMPMTGDSIRSARTSFTMTQSRNLPCLTISSGPTPPPMRMSPTSPAVKG